MQSHPRPRHGLRPYFSVALIVLGLTLLVPDARAAGPSPYRHSLNQVNSHLRLAIELRPGRLAEELRSSEAVCDLAEAAEQRGAKEDADADWSTLEQFIQERDRPAILAVDDAFQRADSSLGDLGRRFSPAWRQQATKAGQLNKGVTQTRSGIRLLRSAMDRLEGAFEAWDTHRCVAAREAIEAGDQLIPGGIEKVNLGMLRLWRLSESAT